MAPTLADNWKELRTRERWVTFLFLGYIPFAGGVAYLVSKFTSSELLVLAAPGFWMVALVFAWFRLTTFPCPRCGKWFHAKWYHSFTRGRKCIHCGLERNAQAI